MHLASVLAIVTAASVRGAALLLLAWLVALGLRRSAAATRHLVWSTAIAGVLLMPVLSLVTPVWRVAVLPPRAKVVPPASTASSMIATEPPLLRDEAPARDTPPVAELVRAREVEQARAAVAVPLAPVDRDTRSLARWLAPLWLAGVLAMLARLGVGRLAVRRLARRARPVDDLAWATLLASVARELAIARPLRLLASAGITVPITWGVLRPVILLPLDAREWEAPRRRAVLLHELSHVQRLDALTQLIAELALAVFWFHPLVWLATHRMRVERERACDDCVLAHGERASGYAADLLELARSLGRAESPAYAALAMARRSELEGRLLAILDAGRPRGAVNRAGGASAALLALALIIPLASLRPVRRALLAARTELARQTAPAALASSSTSVAPAVVPVAPADGVAPPTPSDAPVRGRATPADDPVPTLIAVTRSAEKIKSSNEKATLLLEILDHYVANDSLGAALLHAAATLSSDYDHQRVLSAMLAKNAVPRAFDVALIREAGTIASDYSKALVLHTVATSFPLELPAVRDAFFDVTGKVGSDYERARLLLAVLHRQRVDGGLLIATVRAAKTLSSSASKGAVLRQAASLVSPTDEAARTAIIDAAATLGSDAEYRAVMEALRAR